MMVIGIQYRGRRLKYPKTRISVLIEHMASLLVLISLHDMHAARKASAKLLTSTPLTPMFGVSAFQSSTKVRAISNKSYRTDVESNMSSSPSRRSLLEGCQRQFTSTTAIKAKKLSTASSSGYNGRGVDNPLFQETDVPLVFVPGMKGTHLSFMTAPSNGSDSREDDNPPPPPPSELIRNASLLPQFLDSFRSSSASAPVTGGARSDADAADRAVGGSNKKRAWLSLSGLVNFPPRPDDHPDRCLALPLTYTDGVQDKGRLFPDGIVDHVVELGIGDYGTTNVLGGGDSLFDFFPFYGHATKHLRETNDRYYRHLNKDQSDPPSPPQDEPRRQQTQQQQQNLHSISRPTSVFPYDWRLPLPELSSQLHAFCEKTYPSQPVQILAHSLGGLLTYAAMRRHPDKYAPGAVLVGVPFGTGIQYLEDLHRGYYTEIGRCRQFTPKDQFTFASHWSFFPVDADEMGDTFVEVGNGEEEGVEFVPDVSSIGKVTVDSAFCPEAVKGENVEIDFYDVEEWERNEIGIFDPANRGEFSAEDMRLYKEHMEAQLRRAKEWRETALNAVTREEGEVLPPLVVCATNSVPTINQILRRKREVQPEDEKVNGNVSDGASIKKDTCSWEYDYSSGRSVPGDGRIDFDKAFPKGNIPLKEITLDSLHAKQMTWEDNGGSWGKIWNEVVEQLQSYDDDRPKIPESNTLVEPVKKYTT